MFKLTAGFLCLAIYLEEVNKVMTEKQLPGIIVETCNMITAGRILLYVVTLSGDCVSVCALDTPVRPAKPIQMLFGVWT